MSLANLSKHYELMRFRAQLAEDQLDELHDYLCAALIDRDAAAREWLKELADIHRPEHQERRKNGKAAA